MLDYSHSLPSSSSDALLNVHHHHNLKFSPGHLYLRQQHTVQIIQLVEGPPPPPRRISSVINDSPAASSSSYSSGYSESLSSDDDEGDDQDACESYCSSDDLSQEEVPSPHLLQSTQDESDESYSVRMKRILAWRENFSAHLVDSLSDPSLSSSLKRKLHIEHDDDDTISHSSKRSRSQDGPSPVSLSIHSYSCPACDASFSTRQRLLQHGKDAKATNEACSVAVEYAFE